MYVFIYVCVCNEDLKKSVMSNKTKVRCVFWIREALKPAPLPRTRANDNFVKTGDHLFDILILSAVLPQCDALLPP
jgi:hypothetical protein